MPRPTNKAQLLNESVQEFEALEQLLTSLTPEQMTAPGALGEWSVKDTLAHLHEWQRMFFTWYEAGLRGEMPPTPAEGYNWAQLPALNQKIYETYHQRPLEEILGALRSSHRQTVALIQQLSDEELFTRGRYPWTRNNALGAYLTSNTGSHYRWARTELRKSLKNKS